MHDDDLARRFEAERGRLTAVAHRVLGRRSDADDLVQECWIRLSRVDAADIDNLPGWLTTVTVRLCLDSLRRNGAREGARPAAAPVLVEDDSGHPEHEALLSESLAAALAVVVDSLAPAERVAFVLHDLFGTPYDEIAAMLGRSGVATRQLASRARRRVQAPERTLEADRTVHARVVEAFLAAARDGDLEELVWLLHPEAVLSADAATVARGAEPQVRGAEAVAATFSGRARAARPTLLDGFAAAVWSVRGVTQVVFGFTVVDGRIAGVELISDPDVLALLDLAT